MYQRFPTLLGIRRYLGVAEGGEVAFDEVREVLRGAEDAEGGAGDVGGHRPITDHDSEVEIVLSRRALAKEGGLTNLLMSVGFTRAVESREEPALDSRSEVRIEL